MGGPFMNVPTLAEVAAQASGQQRQVPCGADQQPGTGNVQTIVPFMPVMPRRAPQVLQSWTPDRPPAADRGASGKSRNPFSPVGQGQAKVQQGFAQANAANGNRNMAFEISREKRCSPDLPT